MDGFGDEDGILGALIMMKRFPIEHFDLPFPPASILRS